jgi:DNA repair ATPase RecN
VTRVGRLSREQRIEEIAVMVGDGEISEASRQTAEELLVDDENQR